MKRYVLMAVLAIFCGFTMAQNRSVSGKVTDENGIGLVGATINISDNSGEKNLYQGISGRDGQFSVQKLPAEKVFLNITYLGYRLSKNELDLRNADLSTLNIKLTPTALEVGEVIVNASRYDKLLKDESMPLSLITNTQAEQLPAVTISNFSKEMPGVSLAGDGIWATSMNIRGLTEQRIVTLIDGNRIETATDIAAGMSLIDVNDIERIEVIKGAASSLYGTGALGGVVNIISREGHYHDNFYAGGSLSGMYQSVNRMHSENLSLDFADSLWFVRLSGTYRDAANTMTPKGELLNSQFTDNNVSVKAGLRPFKNHELNFTYQKFGATDVGIPGGSAFPATATATYTDISRDMLSAAYTIKPVNKSLTKIKFRYFHQYILRDVELKPNAMVTTTPSGYHTTDGLQLQTDWSIRENHQLIAGVDLWQRFLSTEREKRILSNVTDSLGNVKTNVTIRGEVPIPDAWFRSGGMFIQDNISLMNKRLNLTIGGRFDLINTVNEKAVDPVYMIVNGVRNNNPASQRITFNANNLNNYSWSIDAGGLFHLTGKSDLSLSLSKAYRAPSLEERFKYIDLGASVEIGDPALKPETGYFMDMGFHFRGEKFQLNTNVFANSMENLIVLVPGKFIYNYSNNPSNYDTLNARINTNISEALLYGFDLSSAYNLLPGFSVKAMAAWVRGKNTYNNTDLPYIPALNGRLGFRYDLRNILSTEISANLTADQDKIAEGEKASTGYASYDLSVNSVPLNLGRFRLQAFGGVENITDRAYRNHLSTNRGVIKYEAGRNIYLKVRLSF